MISKKDKPTPDAAGMCSETCPFHHRDRMEGWPSYEECWVWNKEKHGEEPHYLHETAVCMPAKND